MKKSVRQHLTENINLTNIIAPYREMEPKTNKNTSVFNLHCSNH